VPIAHAHSRTLARTPMHARKACARAHTHKQRRYTGPNRHGDKPIAEDASALNASELQEREATAGPIMVEGAEHGGSDHVAGTGNGTDGRPIPPVGGADSDASNSNDVLVSTTYFQCKVALPPQCDTCRATCSVTRATCNVTRCQMRRRIEFGRNVCSHFAG
jgi:hypothetical protein